MIKWAGGKTKLLPELLARVPVSYNRYIEPFAGGAALFFALAPARGTLNDINVDLIEMYHVLRRDVEPLIARLAQMAEFHNDDYFYAIRGLWNNKTTRWSPLYRAAAFIYLNKSCYNGLWRVNKKGEFNSPSGKYPRPPICEPDKLRPAALALARADLFTGDYGDAAKTSEPGDFIYFDPPYHPVSDTADFTGYSADGFDASDQINLAEVARGLAATGRYVLLSNSDTPFIRDLYSWAKVETVQVPRAINSKVDKRGKVSELLISAGSVQP